MKKHEKAKFSKQFWKILKKKTKFSKTFWKILKIQNFQKKFGKFWKTKIFKEILENFEKAKFSKFSAKFWKILKSKISKKNLENFENPKFSKNVWNFGFLILLQRTGEWCVVSGWWRMVNDEW